MPPSISWRSPVSETSYNPDVLSCLASLSNDEVFTPPQLVNRILDSFLQTSGATGTSLSRSGL